MTAPPEVVELAERFDRYVDAYMRGKYNEAQVRRYAWSAKLPLSILSWWQSARSWSAPGPG